MPAFRFRHQLQARFRDGKTVVVTTETGEQVVHAENVVIATGSEPVELPLVPVYALHPFGLHVPLRVRLFIDFLAGQLASFSVSDSTGTPQS